MRSTPFFHALNTGSVIGDNSVNDMVDWLGAYVALAVKDNGIEYWSSAGMRSARHYSLTDQVPRAGSKPGDFASPVCFARRGNCEGRLIEICLRTFDGTVKLLCWAKSFGSEAQCWEIARACSIALELILLDGQIPALVELAKRLPGAQFDASARSNQKQRVTIRYNCDSMLVIDSAGNELDRRNWESFELAKCFLPGLVSDWRHILDVMQVPCEIDPSEGVDPL